MTHEPGKWGAGQGGPKKNLMQKLINESAHNFLEMRKKKIHVHIFIISNYGQHELFDVVQICC
jgi:hypothetical protein